MGKKTGLDYARGLTLIELMVVLAVVAIFAKVALPSFNDLLLSNRVQAAQAELQNALAMARAEAIKRGGTARVTLVANTLSSSTANWSSGVSVFYDTTDNSNGNVPPTDTSLIVLKTNAIDSSVQVVTSNSIHRIVYEGSGQIYSGYSSFAFGPYSGVWRCTVISSSGRVRSAKITASTCDSAGCCT